jgi:hypothetical protein
MPFAGFSPAGRLQQRNRIVRPPLSLVWNDRCLEFHASFVRLERI